MLYAREQHAAAVSSARQKQVVCSQVLLLPCSTARPAMLSKHTELNSSAELRGSNCCATAVLKKNLFLNLVWHGRSMTFGIGLSPILQKGHMYLGKLSLKMYSHNR